MGRRGGMWNLMVTMFWGVVARGGMDVCGVGGIARDLPGGEPCVA